MQSGIEFNKLQHNMSPRDAVVTFECSAPNMVRVSETVDGQRVLHQQIKRHPNVVTEMERKYMFFASQADLARRQIMHGRSCVFSVYRREP
jgi:hypothetical protein